MPPACPGRIREALAEAEEAIKVAVEFGGVGHQAVKAGFRAACDFAFALGDTAKMDELLAFVDRLGPGERPPYLHAQATRFHARLGDTEAIEPLFIEAEESFAELGMPFWLAIVRFEHAEWLSTNGRQAEATPMMTLATQEFERLEARPWLDRARQSAPGAVTVS